MLLGLGGLLLLEQDLLFLGGLLAGVLVFHHALLLGLLLGLKSHHHIDIVYLFLHVR